MPGSIGFRGINSRLITPDRSSRILGHRYEENYLNQAIGQCVLSWRGTTPAAMFEAISLMAREAQAAGRFFGVTIAASFGCPFEGVVNPDRVVAMVQRYVDLGVSEIALADTIGVAVPSQVSALLARVMPLLNGIPLRLHFHNTRNTGLANAYAAVEAGVSALDFSAGGIGGCPFAPAATGNIPTEDLVYMLERMGVRTGVNLDALIATGEWLQGTLGRPIPSMLLKAGSFPKPATQAA